ncbi:MAG: DUF997 family protein [Eggerthellaceae bacterium]|nr:DUF997 family protein [Eggerthellaceae bacterium]
MSSPSPKKDEAERLTYGQKIRQTNREAIATVIGVVIIAFAWLIGGIGLSYLDIEIFSTPIWIFGGTLLPWAVAIIVAVVLVRKIFRNFSLDDDETPEDGSDESTDTGAGDLRG